MPFLLMTQIQTIRARKAMMVRIREECGILVLTPPRPRSSQRRRLKVCKDYVRFVPIAVTIAEGMAAAWVLGVMPQRHG